MRRDTTPHSRDQEEPVADPALGCKRLQNEWATIQAMIGIYCRDHHGSASDDLCRECSELQEYAYKRLSRCPFQENKPTCGNCTVHCYKKSMREQVKAVMRYAGPRMVYRHPVMALRHLIDGKRPTPQLKKNPKNQ